MAEREWIQGQVAFLERSEITSPLIVSLEQHWDRLRRDRAMPRRDEIDPVELGRWLPYLSVVELHYDPFRVRYRIVGTEVVRMIGEDFSNRWQDETGWSEESIAVNRMLYRTAADSRMPVYGLSILDFAGRQDWTFEWLLLPLSNDGVQVTHCLSLDDFSKISPRSRLLPIS